MTTTESPSPIEPCELESLPPTLSDAIVELVQSAALLGARLAPPTAASLAELVAIMNSYYSNLIEGHRTRPRDIERALVNDLDTGRRRDLQLEARAQVRVQREVDALFAQGNLPEPASRAFLRQLHRSFYEAVPARCSRSPGPRAGRWRWCRASFGAAPSTTSRWAVTCLPPAPRSKPSWRTSNDASGSPAWAARKRSSCSRPRTTGSISSTCFPTATVA